MHDLARSMLPIYDLYSHKIAGFWIMCLHEVFKTAYMNALL